MSQKHAAIYGSRLHLAATFSFIVGPFLFLLVFAYIAEIKISTLFVDFTVSIFRLLAAYLIAVSLAWILALAFATGNWSTYALPVFDVMQSFPTFAIVPLAVLYFGVSNFTIIFFLVITIIWPLLFSTINSLKLVKKEYREVADIYGLKGWNKLKYFLLPASVPGIVTGSIIGLGEGWEALVATEIIVRSNTGLGNFFQVNATSTFNTFLGILALMLIIFSINRLIWAPILTKVYYRMEE